MKSAGHSKASRGRPLSFDRDKALNAAMHQFWRTGYETTSVADLTRAMGITPPSLYAAFGDKESLFLECVERYTNPGEKPAPVLIAGAESARQAAEALLRSSAEWFTQPEMPTGCLVASAAATGSASAERVRKALGKVRHDVERALEERTRRDIAEQKLPADTDARALAALVTAVVQGMSVLARDGADRTLVLAVAEAAMRAWPV